MIIRYEKSGNRFLDGIYPLYFLISMFFAIGISWSFIEAIGLFNSYQLIGLIVAFIGSAVIFGIFHIIWRTIVRMITGRKDYQGLP